MEQAVEQVDALLRRKFPNATTELELSPGSSKVTGLLIWDGFEGEEQMDRQDRVWKVIQAHLTPKQRQHVSAIFTVTPTELAVMREG